MERACFQQLNFIQSKLKKVATICGHDLEGRGLVPSQISLDTHFLKGEKTHHNIDEISQYLKVMAQMP
jgi:hypothetical protein